MAFRGRALQTCWHLVDASDQTVGRLANQIAPILKGKHKPTFLPNKDMGDVVVIVNAEKVTFSGNKWDDKLFKWHTGYPGGLKSRPAKAMLERNPTKILRKAILGMLYRNNLRQSYMEPRLKIYAGPTHPHTAQLPDGTDVLPKHPRKRSGKYHFGLTAYATAGSFQAGLMKPQPSMGKNVRVVEEIIDTDEEVFMEEDFEELEDMETVDVVPDGEKLSEDKKETK
ncbi:protein L13 [Seminavis robusta]|uniref:Protein L13 n=1 Tax=Seminavis robusta TaxID=568900 RepID=A0A9N8HM74_9STRA|nr:protein L13 [Seminavis robusta]|eukprot:Sro874_g214140.1 protein L13 (226) ;mRNA; f:2934-3611